MKKIAVLIVLALAGGGAYLYFQEPEKFKEITSHVENLIAGSDWLKLKNYDKELTKQGLTDGGEKEGYISNLKEKFTLKSYKDSGDGELVLASGGTDAQAMKISYSETSEGGMVKISKEQWKHFFGKEVEFLESGEAESEHAMGNWDTKSGKTVIVIHRKNLEKLPPVEEMPKEVQSAIQELRSVVKEKVAMETKWKKLDDEKHFCFDQVRFKEIVSEMDSLKKQAEALTKKAKVIIPKIPEAQIVLIRKELDGASIE